MVSRGFQPAVVTKLTIQSQSFHSLSLSERERVGVRNCSRPSPIVHVPLKQDDIKKSVPSPERHFDGSRGFQRAVLTDLR